MNDTHNWRTGAGTFCLACGIEPKDVIQGRKSPACPEASRQWRCAKHTRYEGKGKPRLPCETCWRLYIKKHPV